MTNLRNKLIILFVSIIIIFALFWTIKNQNLKPNTINNDELIVLNINNDQTLKEEAGLLAGDELQEKIIFDVPFTAQAPFGDWDDVRQDYGCEEASILMAMYWVYGKELTPDIALKEITAMAEFEEEKYGHFHDTSTKDTLTLLNDYYKYDKAFIKYDINIEDIKEELAAGNLVIVPIDGTKVGNPYYTPPGPFVHKIVIRGYDDSKQVFITNDPGTKRGEAYMYDYQILENAIMDYKTGLQEPIEERRTAMLVIKK